MSCLKFPPSSSSPQRNATESANRHKHFFGDGEGRIVYTDIKKQEPRPIPKERTSSKLDSLAVIGGEGKASISDKLQDHPNHVPTREKSQQLAGETAMPDRVITPSSFYPR